MTKCLAIAAIGTFILSACSPNGAFTVTKPSEVSISSALVDVATGLEGFRNINSKSGTNNGLLLDEVTLTLNLSVSRSDSRQLVVDTKNIAAPALSGGTLGVQGTFGNQASAGRSNTIVVKFKNLGTAALNDTGKQIPLPPDIVLYSYGPVQSDGQAENIRVIDCNKLSVAERNARCPSRN